MAEAAAIISGFKWLAPVAIKLLKKGYTFIAMDVDEKMRDLQNMVIPQMEMLIDAAENHPHKDQLHGWLRTLEKAVYEAEDVLDLHDYYFLKKKVKSSAGGIKRCFLYCSLFFKGQKISRKKLIHLWVANGIIKTVDESKSCKTIEDIGQDYFDELLSSSFFQPTEDDDLYIVHDLLHDLAEMVSKGQFLRVDGNLTEAVGPLTQEIRHLSLRIDTLHHIVEKICNFKNLRTLIIFKMTDDDYFIDDLLHNIFVKLTKLRVVDLGEFQLRKLPESIGGLKHLRHLDLHKSSFEILPESIYTLYHLEFLHISKSGIGSSKQLENLRQFQGDSIHINGLENVKEKGEAPVEIKEKTMDIAHQNLREKAEAQQVLLPSLGFLDIRSCPLTNSTLREEGGSTSILPSSLMWLVIEACHWKQYLDDSQPGPTSSINSESSDVPFAASLQLGRLKSLQSLSITNCPNIGSLLGLQELNHLQSLTLVGCPKLAHAETKLGNLFGRRFHTDAPSLLAEEALASLQHLRIAEFKEESFRSEEEQVFQHLFSLHELSFEHCSIKSLPNISFLKKLSISDCPNITSLPDLPESLRYLSITNCPNIGLLLGLQELNDLRYLTLMGCPKLAHAETKLGSPVLRSFHTDAPSLLHVLLTGEALASLPHLGIHKFKKESFSSDEEQVFRHLTSFNCLSFRSCSIKSLPNNLKSLSSLRSLSIIDCPNITSLPDLPRSLSELNLQLCNPVLKRRCHKPHGQDWCKISHIPTVFRGRGGI
ncbi:putative disease resistance protein [Ananas comosus]|uniref:Putative disease resistance protein n=1 Tax=Ananas comosus TaxID=4615 RepID=A0A199W428_ANACO|nr:putative disease resistance protein [Ananas comosus]